MLCCDEESYLKVLTQGCEITFKIICYYFIYKKLCELEIFLRTKIKSVT